MPKNKILNVRLDEEQIEEVKNTAQKQKLTVSDLVRRKLGFKKDKK